MKAWICKQLKPIILLYHAFKFLNQAFTLQINLFMILDFKAIKQKWIFILFLGFLTIGNIHAQNNNDTILNVAKGIIKSNKYCTLITVDSTGEVHARMMEVFPMESDFIIWFGTNVKSRKVSEIHNNPKVTVYYESTNSSGYLTVYGIAQIIEDSKEKSRLWKKEWENFFTDKDNFVLIKVIPYKLEIISYKHGINGDKETWRAVNFKF